MLIGLVLEQFEDPVAGYSPVYCVEKADVTAKTIPKITNFVWFPFKSFPYSFDATLSAYLAISVDRRLDFSEDIVTAVRNFLQLVPLLAVDSCVR